MFEVEIGPGYSDTALDDVYIDNGACPGYECKDDHTSCQHWASNNQCSENPEYMHINCRVSCGVCTQSEVTKPTQPATVPQSKLIFGNLGGKGVWGRVG